MLVFPLKRCLSLLLLWRTVVPGFLVSTQLLTKISVGVCELNLTPMLLSLSFQIMMAKGEAKARIFLLLGPLAHS